MENAYTNEAQAIACISQITAGLLASGHYSFQDMDKDQELFGAFTMTSTGLCQAAMDAHDIFENIWDSVTEIATEGIEAEREKKNE